MADWLSYTLSDFLLFSTTTYYRLFALYNAAIWPAHVAAAALSLLALWLAARGGAGARWACVILAAAWGWTGWTFVWERYATINWAAAYVAPLFAMEAALLLWVAFRVGRHGAAHDTTARIGLGLLAFAILLQPLAGIALGRSWPETELFGLAPDPTAVGTLGTALAMGRRASWMLMPVPLIWCGVSAATLFAMGAPEAWMIFAAAVLALVLLIGRSAGIPSEIALQERDEGADRQ